MTLLPSFYLAIFLLSSAQGQSWLDSGRQAITRWYLAISRRFSSVERLFFNAFNVDKHVRFLLFTRKNAVVPHYLTIGDAESVLKSNFDERKPTKLLIHGWLNSGDNYFAEQMKNAYLMTMDCNVITVDWSKFSYNLYTVARIAMNHVGPHVAKLLNFLVKDIGQSPQQIHVLGHSLGAHIAGLSGEYSAYNVSRITGMDPASPLILQDYHNRLDSNDAQFVDVIHTSVYYLGVSRAVGHADFYPNGGGPLQPGCGVEIGVCTHRRSYKYFIESLSKPKAFMAIRCDSWSEYKEKNCSHSTQEVTYMGEYVSHKSRGKFYLRTSGSPPFGLGDVERSDVLRRRHGG